MLLIVTFIVSLALIVGGLFISQPKWFRTILQKKYYCKSCCEDITASRKFKQENEVFREITVNREE